MDQKITNDTLKVAIIQAGWHSDIVANAGVGFLKEFEAEGGDPKNVTFFDVPGAFEIPLLAKRLAKSGKYDGIIAAGFVVDGGIYRHDFVASSVVSGLMQVQLETEVPVFSVVLTPHQFQETKTHISFFREHFVGKGAEAAQALLAVSQV